ncbi:unnamed protein product [Effrenium voratum]|nr:unnamed protein product [Effrenium voratum]
MQVRCWTCPAAPAMYWSEWLQLSRGHCWAATSARRLPIQRVTQSMSTGGLVNLDVRIPPEEMLDLASKRLPSATFRRADMTDLTQAFPEAASIAGIMNMFAVHHVDEAGLQSALAEAHRLLKVQGCLMVAFWEGGHGELMEHVPKAWDKAYLWSFDGMKALADKAGFDAVVEFSEKDEDLEMNAGFLYFKKRAEAS